MTKRKLGIVALAAALALSLSGCVKMVQNIVLHDDNTASGEFIIALDKQFAEGMTIDEIVQQLGGDEMTSDMTNAKSEDYDDGEFIGTRVTFTDEPIENVETDGSIIREGDVFIFDAPATESGETSTLTENAVIVASVTFPGTVTEHNGSLSGTTVTWDLLTFTGAPHAVGGAVGTGDDGGVPNSGGGGGIPTWVFIAIGAVVVIGVVFFLSKRGKGKAESDLTPPDSTTKVIKPEGEKK